MRRLFLSLTLLLASFSFTSCESTLDYGYYVSQFDDESIIQMFALTDAAITERDLDEYASFFAPNYSITEAADGTHVITHRADYLDLVRDIFRNADFIEVRTLVMDIEYTEPGKSATVKIQEEERRIHGRDTKHYTSLFDVEVGFEDGWIFIERSKRTDRQIIDE